MKRTSLSVVFGVAVLVSCMGFAAPVSATSLTIGDDNTLGYVVPDTPASEGDEADYINAMLLLASNGSVVFTNQQASLITRTDNTLCGFSGDCDPVAEDDWLTGTGNTGIADGWTYLMGKYGPDSVVWYIGGLTGPFVIPSTGDIPGGQGGGLSHWTLFGADGGDEEDVVPEPTTLLLLGAGLTAASARLRRRRNT